MYFGFRVIQACNIILQVAYPFAYGKILVTVVTTGQDPIHSASVGNFLNPAYVSHTLDNFANPMSLMTRTYNLVMTFSSFIFRYFVFILPVQLQVRFYKILYIMHVQECMHCVQSKYIYTSLHYINRS